jgi:hypothetical protein
LRRRGGLADGVGSEIDVRGTFVDSDDVGSEVVDCGCCGTLRRPSCGSPTDGVGSEINVRGTLVDSDDVVSEVVDCGCCGTFNELDTPVDIPSDERLVFDRVLFVCRSSKKCSQNSGSISAHTIVSNTSPARFATSGLAAIISNIKGDNLVQYTP